jgi:O-antigen/teichoic acid export membrane protein
MGRPELSAKLHLVELPLYLTALWAGIHYFGILGAAVAWTGRMVVDGMVLFWITHRVLGDDGALTRRMGGRLLTALAVLLVPLIFSGLGARVGVVAALLAAYVVIAWSIILDDGERLRVRELAGLAAAGRG